MSCPGLRAVSEGVMPAAGFCASSCCRAGRRTTHPQSPRELLTAEVQGRRWIDEAVVSHRVTLTLALRR